MADNILLAISTNNTTLLQVLIDSNLTTGIDYTLPLMQATRQNQPNIVKLLLTKGATQNMNFETYKQLIDKLGNSSNQGEILKIAT